MTVPAWVVTAVNAIVSILSFALHFLRPSGSTVNVNVPPPAPPAVGGPDAQA